MYREDNCLIYLRSTLEERTPNMDLSGDFMGQCWVDGSYRVTELQFDCNSGPEED